MGRGTLLHSGLFSNKILYFCGIIYVVCLIYATLTAQDTFFNYVCLNFIPIVLYDNADKEKAVAIKSNRKMSGIYRWTHKESGKSYIGSSVNLGQRFASYFTYN